MADPGGGLASAEVIEGPGVDIEVLKGQAAARALDFVEPGMRLGLGTGTTSARFIEMLGGRVADGLDVLCVPTSEATRMQAEGLGIRMTSLDAQPHLDLTVDGADELDGRLHLIKGGGGALLREKVVACASERMIVIADSGKQVETLGRYPLPVEVDRFGLGATRALLEKRAAEVGCRGEIQLRMNHYGDPFLTDGVNHIFDCAFERIDTPEQLSLALHSVPGVVEHGLFVDIAATAIVAGPDGVRVIERG